MTPQEEKPWRTLVRVISKDEYHQQITVCVPGWNSQEQIVLQYTTFPNELIPLLEKDYRFHAKVNIGAEDKDDLKFSDWEWIEGETVEIQKENLKQHVKDCINGAIQNKS